MIDIVKLANGNVAIYDNTSGDFLFSLSPVIIEMQCNVNGSVRIVQNNDNFEFFDPAQVANTQVLPAAAIAFSGTCADLADILATDFFFEMTETIDAIDVNYDNTSSGLTSTNVQDAIDELAGTSSAPNLTTVLTAGNSASNLDIIDLDKLDFNTATTDTAGEGQFCWNDTLGTLNLGLKGGNTILNVGQQIIARVVNKTTPLVPLTKAGYQVVLVAGATGQRLSVKLAKADNDANSAGTLGIVAENIAVNQEGFIVSVGQLTQINTTGSLQGETWNDGDLLYLSPTIFGAVTNVKPSAPFHEVRLGYVEYKHAIHGKIYVKIDNGYEIDELHNVDINSPANNEGLFYNLATLTWQNKTINTALGFTPVTNARTISTTSPLTGGGDLTADRTISIPVATSLVNGYLSSSDWIIFNGKQNALGFTPVPETRTLTINGTTQDLSANRTFTIADSAGWNYIVKSANQDVTNSATLVDDSDFQFSVVAGGHYMIELDAVISSNSTVADYKSGFIVSAGTMKGLGIVTNNSTGSVAQITNITAGGASNTNSIGSGTQFNDLDYLLSIKFIYSFTASSNATFKFQFAQNTATLATTARTWKGSILKYKRID